MTTIEVSLPEAMQRRVQRRIESGLYLDAGEYVRDLIRRDQGRGSFDLDSTPLETLIAEGIADLEAGRVFDADDVFGEMEAAIREAERRKQS